MPPRGATKSKQKRQYKHIKTSVMKRGGSLKTAKRIGSATVNKMRRVTGGLRSNKTARSRSSKKKKSPARKSRR